MRNRLLFLCLLPASLAIAAQQAGPASYNALFENMLCEPKASPLIRAFSGMVLSRDSGQANEQLDAAWLAVMGDHESLTPDVADEQFKWQMRTWVRLYYLFGPDGTAKAGVLSDENVERIQRLFWNYASAKSRVARADLKYIWFIQGSENHDMMDLGNAFLATQVLAKLPAYAAEELPDGLAPAEHVSAWTNYFNAYCAERFRNGLTIEFASPIYGKYFVPELANLHDFAQDARLRANVGALLDFIWADWAVEQLNGVRGGAKARCYQGDYSREGKSDSWHAMGNLLLQQGDWDSPKLYTHPIMGFGPILATSTYRLPPVVAALATAPEKRGEYAYVSRRPGRMTHVDPLPPDAHHSCWYNFARESRLVRYSWCTPDHVLGSYWIDPALREDYQIYPAEPERADGKYAAITGQNLWQGLIFGTNPDARIFPQCQGNPDKHKPEFSTTYVQQLAVQHENVLLVQANRAYPAIRGMRVYFGPGMKERLVELDGWRIIEEGNSYAAVRVFDREDADKAGAAVWDDENFLKAEDAFAPIAFVTGRKAHFATREDFLTYLAGHTWTIEGGQLAYRFADREGNETTLGLFVDEATLPLRNGKPIDLAPSRYYDNPFFQEREDRRAVTVRFGGQQHTIALQE